MSKSYESIESQTVTGFSSEQEVVKFIAATLTRWNYAVQSVKGNKIDMGVYDIGVTKTADDTFELQVYTSRPPRPGGTLFDWFETVVAKLVWQAHHKNQELDERSYYDEPEPEEPREEYNYDNWVPIGTYTYDWFNTTHEYIEFFSKTLNRWQMPTIIENSSVICNDEKFKLTVAQVTLSANTNKNIFEVTVHSMGKHIISMLHEIMDCLCIQANSDREMTEDEAFELINVDLINMTENQVQHYLRNNGCDPRDEINEWTIDYSGVCDNCTRISFCKFNNAVVFMNMKNMHNIIGATFTNSRFHSAIVLENVTFVQCSFDDAVFECKMTNVTFENCSLKNVSWPAKMCNIQIVNNLISEEMNYEDL